MERATLIGIKAKTKVLIKAKLAQKERMAAASAQTGPSSPTFRLRIPPTPTTLPQSYSIPVLCDSTSRLLTPQFPCEDELTISAFFRIRNLDSGQELDFTEENDVEFAPAFAALTSGNAESITSLWCALLRKLRKDANLRLLQTIKENDLAGCKFLLAKSKSELTPQVNAKDEEGWTALHHAANLGCVEILKYIITSEPFVNLNARSHTLRTPLHLATISNHPDAVSYLIDSGANVNCCDTDLWTPLHFAIQNSSPEITLFLLSHGADPSLQNTTGQTAIQLLNKEDKNLKMAGVLDVSLGSVDTHDCSMEGYEVEWRRERSVPEDWRKHQNAENTPSATG